MIVENCSDWMSFTGTRTIGMDDTTHVKGAQLNTVDTIKGFAGLVNEGEAILRYQAQLVESAVANAIEIELDGYKILAVNATCLISEICERLAQGKPFGASYFIHGDGRKIWSLRSREGGIDVSEIAKRHGGGGHRAAAGFTEAKP